MKYKVALYCLVSLLSILITVAGCKENNATSIFPDTNLERIIRWAINQPEGDISQERLENLIKLDLRSFFIRDLTGLEYCINLEELNLETNEITDLSPLSSLKKLETLDLTSNPISDLSPLSECTRLKKLTLINVSISDLMPLSNLILLQSLTLNQFDFDKRLSFSRMRQIEEGDYVGFVDISPLANLTDLRELSLEFCFFKDISVLSALDKLESLSLGHNFIEDISPLTELKNLRELLLNQNQVTNLEAWTHYIPEKNQSLLINLKDCPLDEISINTYIPQMKEAGIRITR